MASKKLRTFNQAAFGWACEFIGQAPDVSIDGHAYISATSVAIRKGEKWPPPVVEYELTLVAEDGFWLQLRFDPRGSVVSETSGHIASVPPIISQSKEVF